MKRFAAAATASLLAALARDSLAEQFILIDATFDYTWDDAMKASPNKSHFYVNEGNFLNKSRPTNWLTPVDYRNGTLHVRTEVFKKPAGTQQVGWTLCYIPNAGGYGCADTTYYTSTGVFDRETKMTDWWNNAMLQWDKGVKQVDLIYAIDDSGSGHITNYPALQNLTTPTRVRITMVQVSAGAKYDPSIIGGLDGGSGPSGDGGSFDAGNFLDAPGASGSGGSAGAGGSSMMTGGMGGLLGTGGTMGAGGSAGSGTMSTSGSGTAGAGTTSSGVTGAGTSGAGTGSGTSGAGTSGAGGSAGGSSTTTSNPGAADTGSENGCALVPRGRKYGHAAAAGWAALGVLGLARRRRRRRGA